MANIQNPVISVFGSSAPKPGSAGYEQARILGQLLSGAGYTIASGGYGGTMMGVSQGAAEAGGHVIGVTSAQIERFRPLSANQWVRQEIRFETLRARLLHLVTENEGMVVLPGGIGTLSEMTLAWSFLQVGEISPRPLVLLGSMWQETVAAVIAGGYTRSTDKNLLQFADTPETAVGLLSVE